MCVDWRSRRKIGFCALNSEHFHKKNIIRWTWVEFEVNEINLSFENKKMRDESNGLTEKLN